MKHRISRRRGAAYAMVAVALVALLASAALSIDVGTLALGKQQLQNAADAAALAAANVMRDGMLPERAQAAAIAAAEQNKVFGDGLTLEPTVDIEMGIWNASTKTITPWLVAADGTISMNGGIIAIKVTCRRTVNAPDGPLPTHFSRILGVNTFNCTAVSTGGLAVTARGRPPVECIIVQDYSGSFSGEYNDAREANYKFVDLFGKCAVAGASDGMGDKTGFVAFGDEVIDSTRYPSAGWTAAPSLPYGTWSNSNVSKSYPVALTRMDRTTDLATITNKFKSTSSTKTVYVSCGSHSNPEYYLGNGTTRPDTYYTSSTNTAAGLLATASMFKNSSGAWLNPDAEHVVVLLSDGMPFYHNYSKMQGYKDQYSRWVPAKEEVWSKAQTLAAANTLGAAGIRLHTVTLCQDSGGTQYGFTGSDAAYNASLVQNGGYAFLTPDAAKLKDLMMGVASVEIGSASLLR